MFVCKFQYYDDAFPTTKEQKAFEKNLFNKTHRANGKFSECTRWDPRKWHHKLDKMIPNSIYTQP